MPLRVDHQPPSMKLPKSIGNFHQNDLSSSNNRSSPTRGKGANPNTPHKEGTRPSLKGAQAAENPALPRCLQQTNVCIQHLSQSGLSHLQSVAQHATAPKNRGQPKKYQPQGRRMPAPGLGTGSCVPCQISDSCSQRNWLSDSGVIGRGHNHPALKCKSGQNGHTGRGTVGPQLLMPARAVDHPWAARHHKKVNQTTPPKQG